MKARLNSSSESVKKGRPALTPEARENQMIAMAFDLAEKQIAEGTCSSQTLNHFLERGALKEKLQLEKLRRENELLKAKTDAIASAKNVEELYAEAIKAMKTYSGAGDKDD